jgi:hypothetical protein
MRERSSLLCGREVDAIRFTIRYIGDSIENLTAKDMASPEPEISSPANDYLSSILPLWYFVKRAGFAPLA